MDFPAQIFTGLSLQLTRCSSVNQAQTPSTHKTTPPITSKHVAESGIGHLEGSRICQKIQFMITLRLSTISSQKMNSWIFHRKYLQFYLFKQHEAQVLITDRHDRHTKQLRQSRVNMFQRLVEGIWRFRGNVQKIQFMPTLRLSTISP